ncbi:MAG: LuxR C-terminal-related transcriptional regulator, partial [Vicingaceae bacterium]
GGAAKPTLSDRELEIIKAISYGNTSKEIASKLFISPRTVESHRRNITKKLNLKNTSEVIKYAFNNNLVS